MPVNSTAELGTKGEVREYWEDRPCGSKHGEGDPGTLEWFETVERRRLELEPFVADFARFSDRAGQRVLEIGVGLGTDFIRFARAGAEVTGVDLTEASVEMVRRRLELEGLTGEVRVADAERLPFDDHSFDAVYSWGVLHHTPDTARAVREAMRVLRPGGELVTMFYARRSWVGYGLWLAYALARGRPWRSLPYVIANHMESPGTKAYTPSELRRLVAGLDDVTVTQVATPHDRRVGGPLVSLLGSRPGWFLVVRGRAPGS